MLVRGGQVAIRIAGTSTCRGCPGGFEGWTGCRPSVLEYRMQPAAAAQTFLRGGQGATCQFWDRWYCNLPLLWRGF